MTKPIPGPNPNTSRPRLIAPPNACDSHMHIFGPQRRYAYDAARNYTPPDCLLPQYLELIAKLGVSRAVFVQPSVYGTDNTCHMDAIREMGLDRARGVAVVAPDVSKDELYRLHQGGFRGVRFNVVHTGGSTSLAALAKLGNAVADLGWHIQIFINGTKLPQIEKQLMDLPVNIVIDHLGNMDFRQGLSQPGFQSLLRMLASGKCWVKLSGAYRSDLDGPPYQTAAGFASALVSANSERLVWGTDWPHPDIPSLDPGKNGVMPDDAILLDALLQWAPDENIRNRILVDNPAQLYDFRNSDRVCQ